MIRKKLSYTLAVALLFSWGVGYCSTPMTMTSEEWQTLSNTFNQLEANNEELKKLHGESMTDLKMANGKLQKSKKATEGLKAT